MLLQRFPKALAVVGMTLVVATAACSGPAATAAPASTAPSAAPSVASTSPASSAPASTAPSAAPSVALSGSITVWSWDVAAAALKRLVPAFEAANPGTTIDVQDIGYDNAYDKISVGLQAGSGLPDVTTIETDHMQPYISKFPDGFMDMTAQAAGLKDQFDPSKWAASSSADGKLFSLPWDSGTVAVFYRSDYFATAGVDPAQIKTWDDFVAAGEKVKAATGKAMINVDVNGSDSIWAELMQQQGASYFNADGQITVNDQAGVNAMTLLKTLYDKGLIDNAKGWDARVAAAKAGSAATQATGVWWIGTLTSEMPELSGKFAAMPLPLFGGTGANTSNNGGSTLAIASTSQNKDLAWAFIKYALADSKNQASMLEKEGLFPAYFPAYQEPIMQAPQPYFGGQKIFSFFGDLTPNIPAVNYTADNGTASDIMTNAQSEILSGHKDVKPTLDDAAKQIANATGRTIAP
jgi:lactose/L-arabinose transport system substrate-binding protein